MPSCECSPHLYHALPCDERAQLEEACRYAILHLSDLQRRSGESYAKHGCEVATVLSEITQDPSLLRIAILHDLPVHPGGEALLARSPLTSDERRVVQELHALRRLHIDANTRDLDRVIRAFTSDERLLPLRMAHRLHDVRSLSRFSRDLQRQIADETLHMYTAIAGRLGMHSWRYEMEDICFRLLQPRIVRQLEKKFAEYAALDAACLRHAKTFLQKKLQDEGIAASIDGRIKRLYSTYRKMAIKRRRFEELTDRLALRIIVPSVKDCYLALSVVHASFHPMPGKLKDYIGAPKENGYRSIHTVAYPLPGVSEQPMEIQIRTALMHDECKYGFTKHEEYKNSVYAQALERPSARVDLFRSLQSLREEARSPRQFEAALRTYFNGDHLTLFDGKNNLYHLKKPVTALDFACHAYGKRCKYLKSVKVNGRERGIDVLLHDGDTVEAQFGRKNAFRQEWLHVCRQPGSRAILREAERCP